MTDMVKVSKTIKENTSHVSQHLTVVERAREIYLAGIKRLEADYFERIKRATEDLTGGAIITPAPEAKPSDGSAGQPAAS